MPHGLRPPEPWADLRAWVDPVVSQQNYHDSETTRAHSASIAVAVLSRDQVQKSIKNKTLIIKTLARLPKGEKTLLVCVTFSREQQSEK